MEDTKPYNDDYKKNPNYLKARKEFAECMGWDHDLLEEENAKLKELVKDMTAQGVIDKEEIGKLKSMIKVWEE